MPGSSWAVPQGLHTGALGGESWDRSHFTDEHLEALATYLASSTTGPDLSWLTLLFSNLQTPSWKSHTEGFKVTAGPPPRVDVYH